MVGRMPRRGRPPGRVFRAARTVALIVVAGSATPAQARAATETSRFRIARISLTAVQTLEVNTTTRISGAGTETTTESVTRRLRIAYAGTAGDIGTFDYRPGLPRGVPVGGVQTRRPVPMTTIQDGSWTEAIVDRFGNRTERSGTCDGVLRERVWTVGTLFTIAGPRVNVSIPLTRLGEGFGRSCLISPGLSSHTDRTRATLSVAALRRTRTVVIPVRFRKSRQARGIVERVRWFGEIVVRRVG